MYFFQCVVDNCFASAGAEMFLEVVLAKIWILMVMNKKQVINISSYN